MHKRLLIPGPTEVSAEMLHEQAHFLIGHRTKEFSELYGGIIGKQHEFFELADDYKITITTSSGSLWFDIVGRSIVKEKALACANGAFSERFGQAVQNCGKEVEMLKIDWGKAVKPEIIAKSLDSGDYDALLICHNETSTGVRNPIDEIGKMVRRDYPDVLIAIDSISGLAGDKVLPSEIGCDVIFASTQKCFTLPPGLAVGIVSDRAIARAREISNRGMYTDLIRVIDYFDKKGQTPFTPNISLLYAFDKRMDLLLEETHDGVYQRYKAMAEYTRRWAKKNFSLYAEPGYESVTVSCVVNTLGKSVKELNSRLAERNLMISNGYGRLAEKTFRIGHMGDWNVERIKEALWHIDEIWGLSK